MNAAVVVLGLAGLVLGALTLGHGGWLAGALIGYLVARVSHMGAEIKALEKDVAELRRQMKLEVAASMPERGSSGPPGEEAAAAPLAPAEPATARLADAAPLAAGESRERVAAGESSDLPGAAAQDGGDLPGPAVATLGENVAVNGWRQDARVWRATESDAVKPTSHPRNKPLEALLGTITRFFTEGNPVVRVGMVVMFFGLSFLVKYASGAGLFPIELRLAIVALVSVVLMAIGWRTRQREGGYGVVLQGGGVAVLYLTIFAAMKLFALLSASAAFALMFAVVVLGAALAILQNAQVLALVAAGGGFITPILTSDGSGSHVALFTFYLLLNVGILGIAWFKTWRLLNWVGFVFTFAISSAWGVLEYRPEWYASTQPFLMAFFFLYLALSIRFSLQQPPRLTGLVDGSLVFGLPTVAFGLQAALLRHTEYGMAFSALALAGIYVVLAHILWRRFRATQRILVECFVALGVIFATLAIPLALDAQWSSASWALEATGLVWVGLRQQRLLARCAGYLLYGGALFMVFRDGMPEAGSIPVLAGDTLGLLLLAFAALGIAWLLFRHRELLAPLERSGDGLFCLAGWLCWLLAGTLELEAHVGTGGLLGAVIVFVALSCLGSLRLADRCAWPTPVNAGFWLLPLAILWTLGTALEGWYPSHQRHPLEGVGVFGWALFAVIQYRFLRRCGESSTRWLVQAHHVLTAWLLLVLLAWEAAWWNHHLALSATASLLLGLACIALPLAALSVLVRRPLWPFDAEAAAYRIAIPFPLLLLLAGWFLTAAADTGRTAMLHVPLLNPLDLAMAAAVLVLAMAVRGNLLNLARAAPAWRHGLPAAALFLWLNVVVLRAMHHATDLPYRMTVLWQAAEVQTALSILWTCCALLVMALARKRQSRSLWIVGALLLVAVVCKLFTQDLSDTGTLARIVSFMVVGGLMLLIGYLSPMPARRSEEHP